MKMTLKSLRIARRAKAAHGLLPLILAATSFPARAQASQPVRSPWLRTWRSERGAWDRRERSWLL